MGKTGSVPVGCGANLSILRSRPRRRGRHSSRTRPCVPRIAWPDSHSQRHPSRECEQALVVWVLLEMHWHVLLGPPQCIVHTRRQPSVVPRPSAQLPHQFRLSRRTIHPDASQNRIFRTKHFSLWIKRNPLCPSARSVFILSLTAPSRPKRPAQAAPVFGSAQRQVPQLRRSRIHLQQHWPSRLRFQVEVQPEEP